MVNVVSDWITIITNAMLGGELLNCSVSVILTMWNTIQVIIIARLHAMYQQSRQMLIFLVVFFLIVQISCGVMIAVVNSQMTWGKLSSWMNVFSTPGSCNKYQRSSSSPAITYAITLVV